MNIACFFRKGQVQSPGASGECCVCCDVTAACMQFLDEPTSGMDPAAKRFTWDVITRHKRHRAVVLTTHSMEEADALSDQIVILAQGKRAAQGSPFDLKERYGIGYTLTVVCHDGLDGRPSADGVRGPGWQRTAKPAGAVCESRGEQQLADLRGDDVRIHSRGCSSAAVRLQEPDSLADICMHAATGHRVQGAHLRQPRGLVAAAGAERAVHAVLRTGHSRDESWRSEQEALRHMHGPDGASRPPHGCAPVTAQEAQSPADMVAKLGAAPGTHQTAWGFGHPAMARAGRAGPCCADEFTGVASRRRKRKIGAVAESTGAGNGNEERSEEDMEYLADLGSLVDGSRSPVRRGRPPRHPGSSPTSASREAQQERSVAQRSAFGSGPGDSSGIRAADVPRLHLRKIAMPGGPSGSSQGRRRTPDSSGSQPRPHWGDAGLPARSASSGDAVTAAAMPARGSRTIRSNMLSFGMHTHGSLDLDGILPPPERPAATAGAAAPAPAGQRVRISPRGRPRRMPQGPPGAPSSSLSPRLPTHHEESPSETPPPAPTHNRRPSWLVTGSLGGVFGSGGLSPSSDSPTPGAGEIFPDEDIFMQSETYRCACRRCLHSLVAVPTWQRRSCVSWC